MLVQDPHWDIRIQNTAMQQIFSFGLIQFSKTLISRCGCALETFSLVKNGRGLFEREVEVDFNPDKYNMEEDPTVRYTRTEINFNPDKYNMKEDPTVR